MRDWLRMFCVLPCWCSFRRTSDIDRIVKWSPKSADHESILPVTTHYLVCYIIFYSGSQLTRIERTRTDLLIGS